MSMAPSQLLVEHDRAGLARKAQLLLDVVDRCLKDLDRNVFSRRRAEAQREQELLAACPDADGVGFPQCAVEVGRQEAAQLVQLDVIVLVGAQQVNGQLSCSAALACFEDHGAPSVTNPRLRISNRRTSTTSLLSAATCASISGVSTMVPARAAAARSATAADKRDRPSIARI